MKGRINNKFYSMLALNFLGLGGDASRYTRDDIIKALNYVVDWLIAGAGGFALIFIIVGAYQYMTSMGNDEALNKAKTTLTWASIGFIIIIVAYAAVKIFMKTLLAPGVFQNIFP